MKVSNRGRAALKHYRAVMVAFVAIALGGCSVDSLLDITDPDILPGARASDSTLVGPLGNGALWEFARAYAGTAASNDQPGVVGFSGLLADELWYSSTFPSSREIDMRAINVDNSELDDFFHRIQRARNAAEVVAGQYDALGVNHPGPHAYMLNLAGFSYIFLGENFCSGVPIGTTDLEGRLTFGAGKTTQELFTTAVARFDAAIAIADLSGEAVQANLARLGKARSLLNMGQVDAAAAIAAEVAEGFVNVVDYSPNSSGQQNGVWFWVNSNRRGSAATGEGTANRGLEYFTRGEGTPSTIQTIDPRVPVRGPAVGIGTTFPAYAPLTLDAGEADIVLASWVEARLIQAEALLDGGSSAEYLTILNDLRASVADILPQLGNTVSDDASLDPLTDPGTEQGRVQQLFDERAKWMWFTGHRLGDLRRMIRQYGFSADEVFPTGTPIFGGVYGTDVNFPIPFVERNNPETDGQCFDRAA